MPNRIRKVAVQSESYVINPTVDGVMEAFDWIIPARHVIEGFVQLRQVFEIQHDVEFQKVCRCESQFLASDSIAVELRLLLEIFEVGNEMLDKLDVLLPRL